MSKTKTVTPEAVATRVLAKYLSPDELYYEALDQVTEKDFRAMEDALLEGAAADALSITSEQEQREMARQEACFRLGLEIGKRIGGVPMKAEARGGKRDERR